MALPHAAPGEPWDVSPLGDRLAEHKTSALFKSKQLEVVRLVMPAGRLFPPHMVAGEITIQCLEGELQIEAQGSTQTLRAGQLLFLPGGETHAVSAARDSSALLTIVLPQDKRDSTVT